MMYRIAFVLLLFFSFQMVKGQGIDFFHGSWEQAMQKAQETDKIIFVDAYAKWCGPCKKMARDVFTQDAVGALFNERFINVKMDMEEPEGLGFGKNYPVSAFPTLFFLDAEGNILQKSVGSKQADALLELAELAIRSYDRTDLYVERYENGERDFDLMINYITELNKVGKPSQKIANEYLNDNPDISDTQKAEFLLAAVQEADSKLYDQLIELKEKAIKLSSKSAFETICAEAAMKTVEKAFEYDYPQLLDEAIEQFEAAGVGDKKQFELEARLYYNALAGRYDEWQSLSEKFVKKYARKNVDIYKEQLSQITRYFDYIEASRGYAYSICEKLIKDEATSENYLFYLRMLMNNKENQRALKVCEEAVEKFGDDSMHNQFEEMLKHLEKLNMD